MHAQLQTPLPRPPTLFALIAAEPRLERRVGPPSKRALPVLPERNGTRSERRRTENFVNLVKELDLLETKQATFTPTLADGTVGQTVVIAEYFAVSEEKLRGLSAEKLVELRDNGALERIYNHLTSLAGWDRLVAIASEKAQKTAAGNA